MSSLNKCFPDIIKYALVLSFILFTANNLSYAKDKNEENIPAEIKLSAASAGEITYNSLAFAPLRPEVREEMERRAAEYFYSQYGKDTPITGNTDQLKYFFNALSQAKSKKIRIAHYGDSILLGDVISQNLRQNLQDKFGGEGAGYLPIYSDDIKMRRSTDHTFSDDWKSASIFKLNPERWPLGISGTVSVPAEGSWVKYEATGFLPSVRDFRVVRLFYSNVPASGSITYVFDNGQQQKAVLENGKNLHELDLNAPGGYGKTIKITFHNCSNAFIYGVSLEDGDGVYVDNFPIKGNSGVSLGDLEKNVLQEFDNLLNYKLIILNYGVNVASADVDLRWYKNKMIRVINEFKNIFPNASFLLVSAGDKSDKKGTRFVSDPEVIRLVSIQKEIAQKTNIAFWDLYEAMGGRNSMNEWVNAKPPLALRDYIHFTSKGGEVVADLLTKALMNLYNH